MRELEDPRRIAEQNAAYRRGVVLGLTMAEVGILIIFVLLLLVGFKEWSEGVARNAAKGGSWVSDERKASLEESERQLSAITSVVGLPVKPSEEEIRALVRTLVQAVESERGQSALQDARDAINEIRRVKDELRSKGYPNELTDQLEKQGFTIANQEGQLKRYEQQLQNAGLGKGERPCWVKPDGTIEFLFDVVLTTNGIRMRENVYPARTKERSALPMPTIESSDTLTEAEFLTRTLPLYDSSLAANCRFFVTVYDGTGVEEKERYKSLLRTVEGHFSRDSLVSNRPSNGAEELRLAIAEMVNAGEHYLSYLRKKLESATGNVSDRGVYRPRAIVPAATEPNTKRSRSEQRTIRPQPRVPLVRRIWHWLRRLLQV